MRHELLATDRIWMILKGAPCREATFLLKVSVSDVLLNLIPIPFDCELGSRYSRQCNFRQSVCFGIPNTDAVSVFQNRLSVRFFVHWPKLTIIMSMKHQGHPRSESALLFNSLILLSVLCSVCTILSYGYKKPRVELRQNETRSLAHHVILQEGKLHWQVKYGVICVLCV